MKKSKFIIILVIVALFSSVFTFTFSTMLGLKYNDKILLPIEKYENLKHIETKYEKAERLETFISENFYKDISNRKYICH